MLRLEVDSVITLSQEQEQQEEQEEEPPPKLWTFMRLRDLETLET